MTRKGSSVAHADEHRAVVGAAPVSAVFPGLGLLDHAGRPPAASDDATALRATRREGKIMIRYAQLCWGDYVAHRWMRKIVAAGLGLELIGIIVYGAMHG